MGSLRAEWWEGRYWPDAGEVVGWKCTAYGDGDPVYEKRPPTPVGSGAREPRADSTARAGRRARGRLRRYGVANRLDRMLTLTTAHQSHDLARFKREFASWVKRGLRGTLGYRGAYSVVFERHASGAIHAHVAVGSFLPYQSISDSWGRGFVFIQRFRPRAGESGRDAARRAAAYLAKYASKAVEDGAAAASGEHRYEVAQGFEVRQVRVFALSARGLAVECGPCERFWYSPAVEAGRGPPVMWAAIAAVPGSL